MRIIDADALKKAYFNAINETSIGEVSIIDLIDNAPTVEAIPNEEGYEMYGKGYLQGYERGKNERLQGGDTCDK